jgi:uncharacterized protein YeaO (DUF488 family)
MESSRVFAAVLGMFKLKRIYEQPSRQDGFRVLVERLWPRGVRKEQAALDLWLKDVAPSPELRKWFSHDVKKWKEFRARYADELAQHADALNQLRHKGERGTVTLLYAAKDGEHNSAVALENVLKRGGRKRQ